MYIQESPITEAKISLKRNVFSRRKDIVRKLTKLIIEIGSSMFFRIVWYYGSNMKVFQIWKYSKVSFKNLIHHPTHQIRQPRHIDQLDNRPFPTFRFSFYYGQCTHTLHGKHIKYHQ